MRIQLNKISASKTFRKALTVFIGMIVLLFAYIGFQAVVVSNWDVISFAITNNSDVREFKGIYQSKHGETTKSLFTTLKEVSQ